MLWQQLAEVLEHRMEQPVRVSNNSQQADCSSRRCRRLPRSEAKPTGQASIIPPHPRLPKL